MGDGTTWLAIEQAFDCLHLVIQCFAYHFSRKFESLKADNILENNNLVSPLSVCVATVATYRYIQQCGCH